MAFPRNLNEFYSTLRGRGAKLTHQFQMNIINTGITEVDNMLSELTMWAKGSTVPVEHRISPQYLTWHMNFLYQLISQ